MRDERCDELFFAVSFGAVLYCSRRVCGSALQMFAPCCVAYRFSSHVLPGREDGAPIATLQNLVLGVEAPTSRGVHTISKNLSRI